AVDVKASPEDRRIAGAARDLPRQPARRRHAADFAFGVDAVTVDGAPIVFAVDESFAHHLESHLVPGLRSLLRVQVVQRIGAAFPFQPLLARGFVDEAFLDLDAHRARELLRPLAHQQVVIGSVGDQLGYARRCAHTFDAGHAAGALLRTVHAARAELDDAVSVR